MPPLSRRLGWALEPTKQFITRPLFILAELILAAVGGLLFGPAGLLFPLLVLLGIFLVFFSSTGTLTPELILVYDRNLLEEQRTGKKPERENRVLQILNRTPDKDAFDVSVSCSGYDNLLVEFSEPIPRILGGESLAVHSMIVNREGGSHPLAGILYVLQQKREDAGHQHDPIFLNASVKYRDSQHNQLITRHKIYYHLWRQRSWTEYVGIFRDDASSEN